MSALEQRVVVIQDASREVRLSPIAWVRQGLHMKAGAKLTFLAVVHQVGSKSKVETSLFGTNEKFVNEEVTRITKEYEQRGAYGVW